MKKSSTLLLIAICYLASCSRRSLPIFSPQGAFLENKKNALTLKQEALNKTFLFYGYFFDGSQAEYSELLEARTVNFKKQGKKVYLIEKGDQRFASVDVANDFILMDYDILSEDAEGITIDLASSKRAFVDDADEDDEHGRGIFGFRTYPVLSQFIQRTSLKTSFEFRYESLIQVERPGKSELLKSTDTLQIAYFFKELTPSSYRPLEYDEPRHRFFFSSSEVADHEKNTYSKYVLRHDLAKPISIVLSHRLPLAYRSAVKEGLLYWNHAFGNEVVKVVQGTKDQDLFSADQLYLDWVSNRNARHANAHWSANPRTGEIILGRIYLPSVWEGVAGKAGEKINSSKKPFLFKKSVSCPTHSRVSAGGAEGELSLEMKRDLIRAVVAHEMGHILGLKHNFAASNQASLSPVQIQKLYDDYSRTNQLNSKEGIASSVMDYLPIEADLLLGRRIATLEKAFSYDEKAIRGLYMGTKDHLDELYCNDEEANLKKGYPMYPYLNCRREDMGSDVVKFFQWEVANFSKNLPHELFQSILKAMKDGNLKFGVSSLQCKPLVQADLLASMVLPIIQMAYEDGGLILDPKTSYLLSPEEAKEVTDKKMRELASGLHPFDGQVMELWNAKKREEARRAFLKIMASRQESQFKEPEVKTHFLKIFDLFMDEFENILPSSEVYYLSRGRIHKWWEGSNDVPEYKVRKNIAPLFVSMLQQKTSGVLLNSEMPEDKLNKFGAIWLGKKFLDSNVSALKFSPLIEPGITELPDFKYSGDLRKKYAIFFNKVFSDQVGEVKFAKEELHESLTEFIEDLSQKNLKDFNKGTVKNPRVLDWYQEQESVLQFLKGT